ncbi:MAG: heavy-metal-associated domain-containing protein [Candidatus Sericytochromatia bacterium]|nr:heavy-metal-associated domain-containing protein [Candidatus Sericytochromatia bacterium]
MTRYAMPFALVLMLALPSLACETDSKVSSGKACCSTTSTQTVVGADRVAHDGHDHTTTAAPSATDKAKVGTETKTMTISGMVCAGCASKLSKSLTKNPAITAANVDYDKGEATITFVKDKITEVELKQLIEKAGFKSDKAQPQT